MSIYHAADVKDAQRRAPEWTVAGFSMLGVVCQSWEMMLLWDFWLLWPWAATWLLLLWCISQEEAKAEECEASSDSLCACLAKETELLQRLSELRSTANAELQSRIEANDKEVRKLDAWLDALGKDIEAAVK